MDEPLTTQHSALSTQHSPLITHHSSLITRSWVLLSLIVALQLALGAAFAVRTPTWQAPDEPAHYNYVRDLAEGRGLPVLQPGDWDTAYLDRIKAARFPDDLPIDPIRYESYQPPLFYALAAPVHALFASAPLPTRVVALRLVSTLLAAVLLVLAYLIVRRIWPADRYLALVVPLFIATLPQHLAVSGAISNDLLAEVILALVVLLLFQAGGRRRSVALGVALGLALLTKATIYFAGGLIAVGLLLPAWRSGTIGRAFRQLLLVYVVALAVAGWWFVRNALVYGPFDLLGAQRHDLVVAGQPRTVYAWSTLVDFVAITFRSFWVQLGWMGVPADDRTYLGLQVLTFAALVGAALYFTRNWPKLPVVTRGQLGLLGLTLLATIAQLLWYNLKFFQAQGRYLFPGLIAIALVFGIGLRELLAPRRGGVVLVGLLGLMVAFDAFTLTRLVPQLRPLPAAMPALASPEPAAAPIQPEPTPTPIPTAVTAAPAPTSTVAPATARPTQPPTPGSQPSASPAPSPIAAATVLPSQHPTPNPQPPRKDASVERTTELWHQGIAELAQAELDGLRIEGQAINLAPAAVDAGRRGTLTSLAREGPFPFDNAVVSWNANAPSGTSLLFELRTRAGGRWSPWYAIGRWSEDGRGSVARQGDQTGSVSVDTLELKQVADALQYRVTFNSGAGLNSPSLRSVAVVYADLRKPLTAPPPPLASGWARDLPVPQYSQLEQDPSVRSEICSPTSLAMVLNYWGVKKSVGEVLNGVFDQTARIWGNWPFNTAYAGALGLEAKVDRFTSMEQLQNEIAAGRPVVISIKYERGQLDNAYLGSTNGHLIVVRGFTANGDVVVNDPYVPDAASARRVYKRSQVANIWLAKGGIVYLVGPRSG